MKAGVWGKVLALCGSAMMSGAGCGRSHIPPAEPDASVAPFEPDAYLAPHEPDAYLAPHEPDAYLAPFEPDANLAPHEPDANLAPHEPDASVAPPDASLGPDARLNCSQVRRSEAPCPSSQWYAFEGDQRCYLCARPTEPGCSSTVAYYCTSWGNGLCYFQCKSNADCTDPCFPFCRAIVLYGGADHCGISSKYVCLGADHDTCDPSSERM